MRKRDTSDVMCGLIAALVDAVAVFGGLRIADWLRFRSGWIPLVHGVPELNESLYLAAQITITLLFLLVLRMQGLLSRPQTGSFPSKIPRLVKSSALGILLTMVLAFAVQNELDFSRLVIALAFFTITTLLLLERWILYRIEWNLARHSAQRNRVLILGVDDVACRLMQTLRREPMLRAKVIGFLRLNDSEPPHEGLDENLILGSLDAFEPLLEEDRVDQVILVNSDLGHQRIVELILQCERKLVLFNMVPDLFRIMTSSMDVQTLDDIPLLGISRWPLDYFWNRTLKRMEDIAGSVFGLLVTAPLLLVAAALIKRSSPGPVFYRQQRCGENGRLFSIIKLRTMRAEAETASGPVFAAPDDPRTTPIGAWLRRHNLDELPQLWNVLCGDMSLVGPRPERPHFVERFREDIQRYMWRHVSKPGMTGWAQVHGLRGNTSIQERIKYDLYYLEHWSLALDFKILLRTLSANENAY